MTHSVLKIGVSILGDIITVAGTSSQIFFVFVFFWSWGGRTSLLSYLYCFVCVFMVIKTMKMAKIEQFWT